MMRRAEHKNWSCKQSKQTQAYTIYLQRVVKHMREMLILFSNKILRYITCIYEIEV